MRDVAERAGVSFKTVSRVINGEGGVSGDLTARVLEAVADLGYRPNHRAKLLRQSDSVAATIGFIMVDVSNPFFSHLLRGIEEVSTTRGCLVLAGSTEGSTEREDQLVEAFVGRRVDGLIVVSSKNGSSLLRSEIDRGTPIVFLDLEPGFDDIDLVRSDHYGGACTATRHLLSHGHVDIAYFGDDPKVFSARLRLQGFLDAMEEAGHQVEPDRIVVGSHAETAWLARVEHYLTTHPRPTAMVTAQNFVTVGAVQALHRLYLQHDIALVGFDDIALADAVEPGITVVPQRPRELGQRAAELLMARIDGDMQPPSHNIVTAPLIVRGSGELRTTEPH